MITCEELRNQLCQYLIDGEQGYAKKVVVSKITNHFCPEIIFVTFYALEAKDYPHGIAENSAYVRFCIDLDKNIVTLHNYGHVYLSKKDQQSDKYKYFAMRSMVDISQTDYGVKKFRKQSYKTLQQLADKMRNYFNAVMQAINDYTGGYPYHEGK